MPVAVVPDLGELVRPDLGDAGAIAGCLEQVDGDSRHVSAAHLVQLEQHEWVEDRDAIRVHWLHPGVVKRRPLEETQHGHVPLRRGARPTSDTLEDGTEGAVTVHTGEPPERPFDEAKIVLPGPVDACQRLCESPRGVARVREIRSEALYLREVELAQVGARWSVERLVSRCGPTAGRARCENCADRDDGQRRGAEEGEPSDRRSGESGFHGERGASSASQVWGVPWAEGSMFGHGSPAVRARTSRYTRQCSSTRRRGWWWRWIHVRARPL
jgi:hypothetical protein